MTWIGVALATFVVLGLVGNPRSRAIRLLLVLVVAAEVVHTVLS